MGTKQNPGNNDCYSRALSGEPMFVLLARDPMFAELVLAWATRRQAMVDCGDRPESDSKLFEEAVATARNGAAWRKANVNAGIAGNPTWRTVT